MGEQFVDWAQGAYSTLPKRMIYHFVPLQEA
jgi:hypothetical protein